MTPDTTSPAFFEAKYQADSDPWNFAASPYELGRYRATVAALRSRHYHRAFEPGCSIGILTAQLAPLCDLLEAMDTSVSAVEEAQRRCHDLANVAITCGSLPGDLPQGIFDLVVFSEIGYYFDELTLKDLLSRMESRIEPDGTLLAVHWLGSSPDHILSGDRVHEIIDETPTLIRSHSERYEGFRLDLWRRA